MELRPGQLVGKNVRLVRLLGEGGMGSVWVADHLTLQTEVAIKFIAGDLVKDPQALKRFTAEATASAQIKSPHVVQVFDHGVFDDLPFIVMELLDGEDLEGRIARAGAVPLMDAALIIKQCARALSQAHAIGIVHRDIKPANVFITMPDGEIFVKLLDFGIAKRLQGDNYAKTATGALIGTPYYMSPEQVMDDREIDFRADLWALSVVTYETLTGALPFDGASLGAICVAINSCQYRPVTDCNPMLPRELDRWFAKAFARRPEERFGTVKELADSLVAIAQGQYGWDSITARTGRISQLPSSPGFLPPPTPPPAPPSMSGVGPAPVRAGTPLPGAVPAVSGQVPMGGPARAGTPLPGGMPAVNAPLPLSAAVRTTTPLNEVTPMPGPWPSPSSPSGLIPSPTSPSGLIPSPTSPSGLIRSPAASMGGAGWSPSRTDPLPPTNVLPIEPHPKQTLSGTTMSDASTTRRKRAMAVAVVSGIAALAVIVTVVVTLTRPQPAADAGENAGDPALGAAPEGTTSAAAPGPSIAPADPTGVPVTPEPDTSAEPPGDTGGSPDEKTGANGAPSGAPSSKPSTKPTTAPQTGPSKQPRRRNHGF